MLLAPFIVLISYAVIWIINRLTGFLSRISWKISLVLALCFNIADWFTARLIMHIDPDAESNFIMRYFFSHAILLEEILFKIILVSICIIGIHWYARKNDHVKLLCLTFTNSLLIAFLLNVHFVYVYAPFILR